MAAPNLTAITTSYGKSLVTTIGTAVTFLISNPMGSNKSYKLTSIYIANIDNAATARVSLDFFRSNTSIRIMDRAAVVPGDTTVAITRDSAIYLEEGDSFRCYSDINGAVHLVMSYEVNS